LFLKQLTRALIATRFWSVVWSETTPSANAEESIGEAAATVVFRSIFVRLNRLSSRTNGNQIRQINECNQQDIEGRDRKRWFHNTSWYHGGDAASTTSVEVLQNSS